MKDVIKKIEHWAEERNLINGSNPHKQFIKLMEEFGELCAGISKNKKDLIIDGIGDCFVVTVIMCKQLNEDHYALKQGYIDSEFSTENNEFICIRLSQILGDLSSALIYKENTYLNKFYETFYKISYFLNKIALNENTNLENCITAAWEQIKDRKGKMINGVFVKEEDLCKL